MLHSNTSPTIPRLYYLIFHLWITASHFQDILSARLAPFSIQRCFSLLRYGSHSSPSLCPKTSNTSPTISHLYYLIFHLWITASRVPRSPCAVLHTTPLLTPEIQLTSRPFTFPKDFLSLPIPDSWGIASLPTLYFFQIARHLSLLTHHSHARLALLLTSEM